MRVSCVLARNDVTTALYVIFLGVVPAVALLLFGIWYIRNSGQHWKKDVMSTYVSSLDRFKKKRKPHVNKSLSVPRTPSKKHYIAGSKFFGLRIVISAYFAPKQKNTSRNANNKIFTISDDVTLKEQITKADLISTTNPDAIKSSNNIEYRKSLLFGNIKPEISAKPQTHEVHNKIATFSVPTVEENQSKKITPHRSELGSKISERIQQIQKKSSRNDKRLKLNTEFKFEHLNESPASTSDVTPKTLDVLVNNSKESTPFYNKKPPPPPAPAQSLKPKI